jgi:hypothetical protein
VNKLYFALQGMPSLFSSLSSLLLIPSPLVVESSLAGGSLQEKNVLELRNGLAQANDVDPSFVPDDILK